MRLCFWFTLLVSSGLTKGSDCGDSPLHTAVHRGDISEARLLMERGADMYALDCDGRSALHLAVIANSLPGIRLFEEFHFELDRVWAGGQTVLHTAAGQGRHSGTRLLLQNGSSVDPVDNQDRTPMTLAVGDDNLDQKVYLLAGFGSRLDRMNEEGLSYLHIAINDEKVSALGALLSLGMDPEAPTADLETPLELALAKDNDNALQQLVQYGADARRRDGENRTLLMVAAEQGAVRAIHWLIRRAGLSTEDQDTNGLRALHYGVSGSRLGSVSALLEEGAMVDGGDKFGGTALQSASSKGSLPIVKRLLEGGADVNSHTIYNWTSLLGASLQGHLAVVRVLLRAGARVGDGWTPMHCAALWGQTPVLQELVRWNAGNLTPLSPPSLALSGFPKDFQLRDKDGFTPLHRASWNGHLDSARLLLDSGAEVNARTHNRTTPLYYSQLYNHPDVSKLLQSRGGTL